MCSRWPPAEVEEEKKILKKETEEEKKGLNRRISYIRSSTSLYIYICTTSKYEGTPTTWSSVLQQMKKKKKKE